MNGRMTNRPLCIKLSWKYWQEKSAREKNPRCCVGSVWGNACFYTCGYYGGCGRVSCAKTFRDCRTQWNRFRSLTGVATKIWGPQHKSFCQCQIFCWLFSEKNHHGQPLRHLCPVAWLHWISSPEYVQWASKKCGTVFLRNVYLKSLDLMPLTCEGMISSDMHWRRELTGR